MIQIKDRTYFFSPPYGRGQDGSADVLVVYYSRSGHTEAMAREIGRQFKADLVRIQEDEFSLNFIGLLRTYWAALREKAVVIRPEKVDLSGYDLVFLGLPIWCFRPAPPLWTFVEHNDFTNTEVALFSTFNSRFKPEEVAKFQKLVENKGGRFKKHIWVTRGRFYNQKSGDELLAEVWSLLEQKAEWRQP
ncbi:MAG: flavodoxin/nitric oxide synthase [Deltaproteobacteria bacterium]|nr:flavodoxin/nitric oxide synthase [Deltaproteobacteria bacterium]